MLIVAPLLQVQDPLAAFTRKFNVDLCSQPVEKDPLATDAGQIHIVIRDANRNGISWKVDTSKIKLTISECSPGTKPSFTLVNPPAVIAADMTARTPQVDIPVKWDRGGKQAGWYTLNWDCSQAIVLPIQQPIQTYLAPPSRFYVAADPSIDDLDGIRKRWVGKKVWVLGSAARGDTIYSTFAWSPLKPATVTAIDRFTDGYMRIAYAPPAWDGMDGWGPSGVPGVDELKITIAAPPEDVLHTAVGTSEFGPEYDPQFIAHGAGNTIMYGSSASGPSPTVGNLMAADEWELPSIMTTTPPEEILKHESPRIRKAFAARMVVKGMPRSLVVRLLGYPAYDVAPEELNRQATWIYYGNAPFDYQVDFDSRDRVKYANMTGELP